MKKNLLFLFAITVCSFIYNTADAQSFGKLNKSAVRSPFGSHATSKDGAVCDTSNLDIADLSVYTFNTNKGYISGPNNYYTEIAASFDLSSSQPTDTYINGMMIYFAHANSNVPANLSRSINFNVYSNDAGIPGTLLYTTSRTIADISTDVNAGNLTSINISPGIALPADKTFFITVDFSNLTWTNGGGRDTVAIVTGDIYTQGQGSAFYNSVWTTYNDLLGLDLALTILPITSGSPSCAALPLNLLSFNIQKQNKNTLLSWSVANEVNMKQYEIQRAGSNLSFTSVSTVNATNTAAKQTYSYTDFNALASVKGNIYYRLKQVNKDGSFTYSKVISVNSASDGPKVIFTPNPFSTTLAMQMNMDVASKATIRVYDMQGKFTGVQLQTSLSAGNQSIEIPSASNLKAGTYVIDIALDTQHLHYVVVKK